MTLPADILERPVQTEANIAGEMAESVSSATVLCRGEPMARHTTLRVGGPADVYVEPASEADLAAVVKFCGAHGVPFFVIGRGSNLLVRDGGFRGVVICLASADFCKIEIVGQEFCRSGRLEACPTIRCGAGAKLKSVAIEARRRGLSGLEFLEGIPGSVGGALRMNAGAMGSQTFDVVESVRLMDCDGNVCEVAPADLSVKYRGCDTLKNHIALGAGFKGRADSPESIAQRMSAFNQKRWASQPAAPSAGCAFKNPPSIPAGKLIDELGLKGARVGGAVVSREHGNFIVNDGDATARDVLELIEMLKAKAKAERGIELQTEVEIVGDEN